MKIDCTIDGKTLTLSLNSDKPLSLILRENMGDDSQVNHCNGSMCGLCTVLVDGKAMLACMVPAFEIRGRTVTTFDSFRKTRNMKDIEKAFSVSQPMAIIILRDMLKSGVLKRVGKGKNIRYVLDI